ncbi:YitT family protein [Microbacterium sp. C7(2022)]|uniref:membrane protein YczE n=1 Tax=Microbacterium sp. C7(2022) TaxID=2992759 RepID=UPI00237B07E8|nr:hypothetical protein [Microbacterium sp. C7(2022)]MDE0546944.1 hypothetical protein [Microbacterium sp. C7(2022)]
MPRRIVQLLVGLLMYGAGCALTVRAGLGVDPWTVFAEGLSLHTGIGIGWITNILGALVLLAWIPLRQKPGVGTLANVLIVGTSMQATLWLVPPIEGFGAQFAVLMTGIGTVAVASGLYLGAHFGPGPRDGLMTGMHARWGWPIWLCRGGVELTVLTAGWFLGGTVGIGTVLFAVLIGPLVQLALPILDVNARGTRANRSPVSYESAAHSSPLPSSDTSRSPRRLRP